MRVMAICSRGLGMSVSSVKALGRVARRTAEKPEGQTTNAQVGGSISIEQTMH